jgi:hypothetical protein
MIPDSLTSVRARVRTHLAIWVGLVTLVIPASAGAVGLFKSTETEGLKITIDADWAVQTAPGYLPVRFDITNLTEPRVIEIVAQGRPMTYRSLAARRTSGGGIISGGAMTVEQGRTRVRQTLRLARGDRVRFTMSLPVSSENESFTFEIRENSRVIEALGATALQSGSALDETSALIVASSGTPFGQAAAGWSRPIVTSRRFRGFAAPVTVPPGSTAPPLDFVLDPARVPSTWLGFTSLRAVIIGATEWQQLSDEQRGALRAWAASGGDLYFADGELSALLPEGQQRASLAQSDGTLRYLFGHIHLVKSADITSVGLAGLLAPSGPVVPEQEWSLPVTRATDWGSMGTRGYRLPIPGIGTVRARAFMVILLVFTVIIGPVNYVLLRRRRQQAMVVVTAPLISVMFILMLAGYVVAGEGFAVHARAATLTLLDQPRQAAVTRASASLYAAGRTPSTGLRFPRDVAVYPIGGNSTGHVEETNLDLSDSQQFATGFVRARSPINFESVAFRPARERLEVRRSGDRLSVVNGLGATIVKLHVKSGDRAYALAAPLAAGATGSLQVTDRSATTLVTLDQAMYGRFYAMAAEQPGDSYLAELDRSPFWQSGVSEVAEHGSLHLVLGLLEALP